MNILVRFIRTRGAGQETHEVSITSDRATIGRGTNQSIQILDKRVPLSHSTLSFNDDRFELRAERGQSFTVNGEASRSISLNDGDLINILGHEIRVLAGSEGYERILEVKVNTETLDPLRNRFKTRLWELKFPLRKVSWGLFLIIIFAGVLIPSVGFLTGMDFIRSVPAVPDDSLWKTGKLHDTHAFLGDNCENCHAIPFVPARDEECLNCHISVTHHFDTDVFGRDYQVGDTCQDCHREHGGNDSIIRSDQGVCTVCHADMAAMGFDTDRLRDTTDFLDDHPSFMISMLEMNDDESWELTRKELWDDELAENSNLKFPHELHMSAEGINSADDVVIMECSDCHTSEKGGLRMKTVTMEKHCASCHQLTFDTSTPDRVVPHGKPEEIMSQLQGYYANQFLLGEQAGEMTQGASASSTPAQRPARRPGKRRNQSVITDFITEEFVAAQLTSQAREYIDRHVANAATNLFERQTCVVCHIITPQDATVPWKIAPVRLTPDWFPYAEFSHGSHKNMSCDGCHDAKSSTSAEDVLMPDIVTCQTCHGGEHAVDKVQSTCIACHKFHLEDQGPMGMLLFIDEDGNLVDSDGNFVDEKGNLIDDYGNLLDEDGNPVDEDGNLIDEGFIDEALIDEDDPFTEQESELPEVEEVQ